MSMPRIYTDHLLDLCKERGIVFSKGIGGSVIMDGVSFNKQKQCEEYISSKPLKDKIPQKNNKRRFIKYCARKRNKASK